MKVQMRRYALSFAGALILTGLVAAAVNVPGLSAVGVLLAPGMLAAGIFFPEGINSEWANTYLVIAGLLNAVLLAWPMLWLWTMISRARQRG
jgi:ABC-type proline/glycine betaine transport system permease subunit